jgi:hypothetical protein
MGTEQYVTRISLRPVDDDLGRGKAHGILRINAETEDAAYAILQEAEEGVRERLPAEYNSERFSLIIGGNLYPSVPALIRREKRDIGKQLHDIVLS